MNTTRIRQTLECAFEQLGKGDLETAIEALDLLDEQSLTGEFALQRESLRKSVLFEQKTPTLTIEYPVYQNRNHYQRWLCRTGDWL